MPGIEVAIGDLRDRRPSRRPSRASKSSITSPPSIGRRALSRDTYRAVNATAAGELVEAAAAAGVRRVVHCSTVGVHGDIEHPPANEDAPLRPGDIYQETKLEGEQAAREAGARLGIEVTIARPSGIYGPGDRRLLKLFRGVARRRWITLGRGKIYYHLTYIDDLVEGFRLCGEHPAAANRTYILAGGEVTTLNELVAIVAERGGRARAAPASAGLAVLAGRGGVRGDLRDRSAIEPPIYRRRVDFFTKSRAFDITRAQREIGYAPQVGLRDGVTRTIEWYRRTAGLVGFVESGLDPDVAGTQGPSLTGPYG